MVFKPYRGTEEDTSTHIGACYYINMDVVTHNAQRKKRKCIWSLPGCVPETKISIFFIFFLILIPEVMLG